MIESIFGVLVLILGSIIGLFVFAELYRIYMSIRYKWGPWDGGIPYRWRYCKNCDLIQVETYSFHFDMWESDFLKINDERMREYSFIKANGDLL